MTVLLHDRAFTPAQDAWHQWLFGLQGSPCAARVLAPAASLRGSAATCSLRDDWTLVDWLFPADRYADARSGAPALSYAEVPAFLGRRPGLDDRLRIAYVGFLGIFGASVDWQGWVSDWCPHAPGVLRLPDLDEAGMRAVARVLRFVHLAGWRGYSADGYRDPADFWYARAFHRWLVQAWQAQAPAGRPFPAVWNAALRDAAGSAQGGAGQEMSVSAVVAHLVASCQRRVHQFTPWAAGLGRPRRAGPPPVARRL